eukprot:5609810-Amphidinium_carterae.3
MSKGPWKPGLSPYEHRSSGSRASGSSSSSSYVPWGAAGWNAMGHGSSSAGSHMAWGPAGWNTVEQSSSSTGYYMPWGSYGWNAGLYETVPPESTTSWGTAGWHTGGRASGSMGSSMSRKPEKSTNDGQTSKSAKPHKKVSLESALSTPAATPNGPIQSGNEPVSRSLETMFEEFEEDTTAQETIDDTTAIVPPVSGRTLLS